MCFDALYDGAPTTLIGASGAISAVMGAFLVFFARMEIHFAYWLGRGIGTFHTVAYVALPLWFGEQVLDAWASGQGGVSTVAFTAHIGGFLFGLAAASAVKLLARRADDAGDLPRAVVRPPGAAVPVPPASSAPAEPKVEPAKPKIESPKPKPPSGSDDGPSFLG